MITGEPGIGKTRLLEEFSEYVIASGAAAAWGRTLEVGLTPPFWPWAQVLNSLQTSALHAPELLGLTTSIDLVARLARFGDVCSFIKGRTLVEPVVVLLDDLHAADPSSLQLLEYLLPQFSGRRVLFALAARDAAAMGEVAAALGRIQRNATRMPLGCLGQTEVSELVGDRADPRRVFELSEGNPLFVEELVASQSTRGTLGLARLSSARLVIRERVAQLPEATRVALLAGAVLGREFRASVVAATLGVHEMRQPLAPAVSLGIIVNAGLDRFRFSHALLAEALCDDVPAQQRTQLHLAAAAAIEQLDPTNTSAIAHHLLSAGNLAAQAAVAAAERAAWECMAHLAFEDSALLLERALEALNIAAPADRRKRAELLRQRAEALQYSVQHAAAATLCDEAATIARALADEEANNDLAAGARESAVLFARIALTRGLEFRFGHTNPILISLLSEALERLGAGAPPLRAKLLARLAAAEQPARNPNAPVARAFEAIEIARQLSQRDQLEVMYVATSALVEYVDPERLEAVHQEVLRLARGADRTITVHTRLRLCFTALERLDRQGFDAAAHAFAVEADALGLPQWIRNKHMLSALTALLEGRFADAELEAQRAEAISRTLGDSGAEWMMAVHRVMAAWVRTAPVTRAARTLIADYAPGRAAVAAWLALQEGDRERARAALNELEGRVPTDPDLASMVGSAAAFVGDAELAKNVYDTLATRSGRVVLASMVGSAVMDLYDRVLLVLAAAAGLDAIDFHAERALSIAARLGSPPWAARVHVDWAESLLKRGHPGDRERAEALRRLALPEAERLRMPGLVARCQGSPAHVPALSSRPTCETEPLAAPCKRDQPHLEFLRQGGLWRVCGFAEQVFVKDSRGIQMIAKLVEHPGAPLHVFELASIEHAVDGGDAGPVLDAPARAAYRQRAAELSMALQQAEAAGDLARRDVVHAEIEALTEELARAFGLGGRERRVGVASERARTNAQRRIAHGIGQIRAASPRIAEHLVATLHTGTYCLYQPVVS
jgi:hypothetical protein